MKLIIIFVVTIGLNPLVYAKHECSHKGYGICLLKDYNQYKSPSLPLEVDASIRIRQLTRVKDSQAYVEFAGWLIWTWTDDRIILEDQAEGSSMCQESFGALRCRIPWPEMFNDGILSKIWYPDITIVQLKEIEMTDGLMQAHTSN